MPISRLRHKEYHTINKTTLVETNRPVRVYFIFRISKVFFLFINKKLNCSFFEFSNTYYKNNFKDKTKTKCLKNRFFRCLF